MAYLGHVGRGPDLNKTNNLFRFLSDTDVNLKIDEKDNRSGINIYNNQQKVSELTYDRIDNSWKINDIPVLFKTEEISTSKVLNPFVNYFVDSKTRPVVLFLPQFPNAGDEINISDLNMMFDVNNVTIYRNHNRIGGTNQDIILDVRGANVNFKYVNSDIGWVFSVNNNLTLSPMTIETHVDESILSKIVDVFTNYISQFTDKIGDYLNRNLDLTTNPSNHFGIGLLNFINANVSRITKNLFNHVIDDTSKLVYNDLQSKLLVDQSLDVCIEFDDFNAEAYKNYWVNTVGKQIRVILPLNPCQGTWIVFFDHEKSFDVHSVIIEYNGVHTINNNTHQLELNTRNSKTRLVFKNGNWFIF